ncbi:FAD-binding oxidoreductase [Paraburkholderia fungorum]|uniref:flavin reductase family protein n=1 Tax=Paraburkholderia fungorum TaxID=134537 RepID=UPI0038B97C63
MTDSPFREVTCAAVTSETWNVKTFHLSLDGADRTLEFRAGQYVTLEFEIDGQTIYRCYTVSSAPHNTQPGDFCITVKHSPDGVVSTWLHRNFAQGDKLRVSRATGDFVLPEGHRQPLLFIAGGVGITPFISMVRALRTSRDSVDVQFIQFARLPEDIMFQGELKDLGEAVNGLRTHFFASTRADSDCHRGRLSEQTLDETVPDWTSRSVYCCGPDGFMASMRNLFERRGGASERFHQESFELPAEVKKMPSPTGGAFSVRLALSNLDLSCSPGRTIIEAVHASPQGIKIPNACRSGVCGTCKLRKLSGEVEMLHNGGITDEEVDEGYVLACCSTPLTDLLLEC